MERAELNAALLGAHDRNDKETLVTLYRKAGQNFLDAGEIDAGCFYLTQAYIFALDTDHDTAPDLHRLLVTHGRET